MRTFKTEDETITIEQFPSGDWWIYFTAKEDNGFYNSCGPFPIEGIAIKNVFRLRKGAKEV